MKKIFNFLDFLIKTDVGTFFNICVDKVKSIPYRASVIGKPIFKIKDKYNNVSGCGRHGYFFSFVNEETDPAFHSCRETFETPFVSTLKYVGFCSSLVDIIKVNAFFKIVETKLKLKEKTIFSHTNYQKAIIAKVPEFWRETRIKRSLFTLLLRCAANHYDGKDFNAALEAYQYAKETKKAILRFLVGFTESPNNGEYTKKSTYGSGGWVTEFKNAEPNFLKTHLKKPKKIS